MRAPRRLRPTQRGMRPKGGAEPGIENVRILHQAERLYPRIGHVEIFDRTQEILGVVGIQSPMHVAPRAEDAFAAAPPSSARTRPECGDPTTIAG